MRRTKNNRIKKHARFFFKMDKGLEEFLCGYKPRNVGFPHLQRQRLAWGSGEEMNQRPKCKKYMGRVNTNLPNSSSSWNSMKEYKINSFF